MKKYTSLSLTRYLAELSSKKPVPGGGSVSAYAAGLGMGLAEMAAQIGKKKAGPESQPEIERTIRFLRKARKNALEVVNLDPEVYQTVLKAYTKAKRMDDAEKKNQLVDEALENSFRLQADLALLVVMAKEGVKVLSGLIRGAIANDLKVSAALLDAAFHGSFDTAKINGVYLKNPEKKRRAERALEELARRFKGPNGSEN